MPPEASPFVWLANPDLGRGLYILYLGLWWRFALCPLASQQRLDDTDEL